MIKITYEPNKTVGNTVKVLCSSCKNVTNHLVLTSINERGSDEIDENFSVDWKADYEIIQCKGCETVSFRTESSNSEDDDHDGRPYKTILLYPKRSDDTLAVKNFMNVPFNLQRIYRETVDSFNYGNYTLCGAGVRALVEGLCKENGVTGGNVEITNPDGSKTSRRKTNLQGKINGLYENGKLTEQSANILHEHRFLGNDAVHELSAPSKEGLELAIEIVENVFETLYEIPSKGLKLKSRRLSP